MKKAIFLSLGLLGAGALTANAALINRYSFNNAAGGAPAATGITDSVGGANGVVIGDGATFTGSAIDLPGGAGGTSFAAFIDLPNGLLSAHNTVTFEAWYSVESTGNAWQRVWDFGSTTNGGENNSQNIGSSQGLDYFMYAPMRGGNLNQQRNSTRNNDATTLGIGTGPVDGTEENVDSDLASTFNTQYHIASIWEWDGGTGGTLTQYRDGALIGTQTTTYYAQDMNDVNNWLGRSNWTGDGYLDGEIDEFRIWNEAFDADMAAASFAAGPDLVVPEPTGFALVGIAGLALLLRRRR